MHRALVRAGLFIPIFLNKFQFTLATNALCRHGLLGVSYFHFGGKDEGLNLCGRQLILILNCICNRISENPSRRAEIRLRGTPNKITCVYWNPEYLITIFNPWALRFPQWSYNQTVSILGEKNPAFITNKMTAANGSIFYKTCQHESAWGCYSKR